MNGFSAIVLCEFLRVARVRLHFAGLGDITAGAEKKQRRREIATLMTRPENGLFARTIVNRIWARLFGGGLVEPLEEMMEHEPWSPELLDWLAAQFVRDQYDLKKLLPCFASQHLGLSARELATDCTPIKHAKSISFPFQTGAFQAIIVA